MVVSSCFERSISGNFSRFQKNAQDGSSQAKDIRRARKVMSILDFRSSKAGSSMIKSVFNCIGTLWQGGALGKVAKLDSFTISGREQDAKNVRL